MKYFLLIVSVLFASCRDEPEYHELRPPIVVTAITGKCVVLHDSSGLSWYANSEFSTVAQAIIGNYKTGDTLK